MFLLLLLLLLFLQGHKQNLGVIAIPNFDLHQVSLLASILFLAEYDIPTLNPFFFAEEFCLNCVKTQ